MRAVDVPLVREALADLPESRRIRIIGYDPPWFPNRAKTGDRLIRFHNLLWQIGAFFLMRKMIRELNPDLAHHLTWGVFRQPSLLGLLDVPFIFGPVGGGETTPFRLRYNYSLRAHLFELLRDSLNLLVRFDPLMAATFARARLIAVRTDETRGWIPKRFHRKVVQYTELGVDKSVFAEDMAPRPQRPLRILFVGRLLHWKGIYYVIEAYHRLLSFVPDAQLTLIGQGLDAARLHRLAAKLGIEHRVNWIERVEYTGMGEIYRQHDVFFFPSLHESGGTVVVEALSHGLPVITLDIGGPKEMVDNSCGRVIRTAGLSPRAVIAELALALRELADPHVRDRLSLAARSRARNFFTWEYRIEQFYGYVAKAGVLGASPDRAALGLAGPIDVSLDHVE